MLRLPTVARTGDFFPGRQRGEVDVLPLPELLHVEPPATDRALVLLHAFGRACRLRLGGLADLLDRAAVKLVDEREEQQRDRDVRRGTEPRILRREGRGRVGESIEKRGAHACSSFTMTRSADGSAAKMASLAGFRYSISVSPAMSARPVSGYVTSGAEGAAGSSILFGERKTHTRSACPRANMYRVSVGPGSTSAWVTRRAWMSASTSVNEK